MSQEIDRDELHDRLWMQAARLVVPRRGPHLGLGDCDCDWCEISRTLRALDEADGLGLAAREKARADARRAAMEPARVNEAAE